MGDLFKGSAENCLVTATKGLLIAKYVYGPLDRRIAKTVTTSGGNPVETRYLYAGSDVISEFTGMGFFRLPNSSK
ncbi:MAG: hypothetical protein RIF37_01200 [Rhodospirillaceae bacterium]